MSDADRCQRARRVRTLLKKAYPDARTMLDHRNAYELLIATILAAQCTDAKVNEVTRTLFREYPDPESLAKAKGADVEKTVKPTGFFRQKTKSILGTASGIVERFGGKVPDNMEDLTSLPGVGRKTANIVLGECFGKPGIVVDTHLKRVTARIGLAHEKDPDKIEAELDDVIAEKDRTVFSHVVTFHGRRICVAAKPRCPECVVRPLCDYFANVFRSAKA